MSHELEKTEKRNRTITPEWHVPIYVALAWGVTMGLGGIAYQNIINKLDAAVTQPQLQGWIDDAREKNPAINWPRLPEKKESKTALPSAEAVLTKRDE